MASLLRLLEMPELTDKRSWSEMSARSSQEFEECAACFYLSSRVYQRLLRESTRAFAAPVFRMQTGVSAAPLSSPVCLLACRFLLYLCFVLFFPPSRLRLSRCSCFPSSLPLTLTPLTLTCAPFINLSCLPGPSESRSPYGPWV